MLTVGRLKDKLLPVLIVLVTILQRAMPASSWHLATRFIDIERPIINLKDRYFPWNQLGHNPAPEMINEYI